MQADYGDRERYTSATWALITDKTKFGMHLRIRMKFKTHSLHKVRIVLVYS